MPEQYDLDTVEPLEFYEDAVLLEVVNPLTGLKERFELPYSAMKLPEPAPPQEADAAEDEDDEAATAGPREDERAAECAQIEEAVFGELSKPDSLYAVAKEDEPDNVLPTLEWRLEEGREYTDNADRWFVSARPRVIDGADLDGGPYRLKIIRSYSGPHTVFLGYEDFETIKGLLPQPEAEAEAG